MKTSPYHLVYG
jgi:hypothetical protein